MRTLLAGVLITCAAALLVGCDIPASGSGTSPLIQAARAGLAGEVSRLIRNGANPNQRGGANGWTPLMHAIHKSQLAAVKALIDNGADVNAAGKAGETPLMMAASYGDTAAVKLLLEAGADARRGDNDDKTALDYAVMGVPDIDKFTLMTCQSSTVRTLLAHDPSLRLTNDLFGHAVHALAGFKGCSDVLAMVDHSK